MQPADYLLPGNVQVVKHARGSYTVMVDGQAHSHHTTLVNAKRDATRVSWVMSRQREAAEKEAAQGSVSALAATPADSTLPTIEQVAHQRGVSPLSLLLDDDALLRMNTPAPTAHLIGAT